MSLDVVKPVDKSFDTNDFLAIQPVFANLPTITESDEDSSGVPIPLTNSPSLNSSEPEKKSITLNPEKKIPTIITRPNTPDTDKTAVDSGNIVESPSSISPSGSNSSRPNTPNSDKNFKQNSFKSKLNSNSRPHTPDINKRLSRSNNNNSPSTLTGSRTPSRSRSNTPELDGSKRKSIQNSLLNDNDNYEMKPLKEPLTSSNFIHLGIPGEINFPSANIREISIGVFHIFNPLENPISWSLIPAAKSMFRRLGTATNAAQKVEDDIFVVTKPRGFLRPKHAERVDVKFRPLGVGTYSQTYVLEGTTDGGGSAVDSVSMKFQGIATENTFNALLKKHKASQPKEIKFEVDETTIKIPSTRIGKQRSLGIKISNVAKEAIRLICKCETTAGPGGKFILSLPMNSVVIKPGGFSIIPVRFQPRVEGEVKGVVTIQSPQGNAEVKVDIVAKGILDTQQ
ncbi:405_t:CDS:1 [Diversispora eburnea]|uniref:405_t:CDS:1 n=1 Tax=Diversispora eburnea TaxID=1213867 RepID=A0A9N8WFF4_9GLOM|nr:405_t:CDS:1 [Diversispora eburnea]